MKPFTTFFEEYLVERKSARQEGEGDILYHVSKHHRIVGGKHLPMTHFGTFKTARDAAQGTGNHDRMKSLQAVRIKHGKSFKIRDIESHHPHDLLSHLHDLGMFNKKEYKKHSSEISKHHPEWRERGDSMLDIDKVGRRGLRKANRYLAQQIRNKGYHSLHYVNSHEGTGETSHIITHPSQVRIIRNRQDPQHHIPDWHREGSWLSHYHDRIKKGRSF